MTTTTAINPIALNHASSSRGERGGAAARRPASAADAPRTGNTGGISPIVRFETRSITCHWLRVIYPAHDLARVRDFLVRRFGEPDRVRGRWFYEYGERFANGTLLLTGTIATSSKESTSTQDDFHGTICVDVPGGALDDLESDQRAQLCHDLILGGRVSRIDLAVDAHHSRGVGLINAMIDGCAQGHLCGAKRWEPKLSYHGSQLTGYGVCIGKRGNLGSGKYVRAYDKGLEAGDRDAGQWERFEVEFSSDAAAEVAVDVFSNVASWEERAWSRVCGVISFHHDDASNGELARRTPCQWWSDWLTGIKPIITRPIRAETTLLRHTRWLRDTVLPTIARLADAARLPWADALVELVGHDLKPRASDKYMRSMIAEWMSHLRGDVHSFDGTPINTGARHVAAA